MKGAVIMGNITPVLALIAISIALIMVGIIIKGSFWVTLVGAALLVLTFVFAGVRERAS